MPLTPDDTIETDDVPPPPAPQGFSEIVRDSPLTAVIGAFIAGMIVSRLL